MRGFVRLTKQERNSTRNILEVTCAETAAAGKGMKSLRRELEKVYDECGKQLFTCALAVTNDRALAEDTVHEAFSRLFRLEHVPRKMKAYVFRCVRNAAIDTMRRSGRTTSLSADHLFDSSAGPREVAEKNEFQERAARALSTLTETERETIVQHLYADLTFREIAELRDISIGTVTSWYRRGLAKLRTRMEE